MQTEQHNKYEKKKIKNNKKNNKKKISKCELQDEIFTKMLHLKCMLKCCR